MPGLQCLLDSVCRRTFMIVFVLVLFCRSIGAEVLIDDNPSYAVECAQAGIHVLLYDWDHSYPWSKTAEGPTHDLITRWAGQCKGRNHCGAG